MRHAVVEDLLSFVMPYFIILSDLNWIIVLFIHFFSPLRNQYHMPTTKLESEVAYFSFNRREKIVHMTTNKAIVNFKFDINYLKDVKGAKY